MRSPLGVRTSGLGLLVDACTRVAAAATLIPTYETPLPQQTHTRTLKITEDWFRNLPPVTKCYLVAAALCTLLSHFGLINGYVLVWDLEAIKRFQVDICIYMCRGPRPLDGLSVGHWTETNTIAPDSVIYIYMHTSIMPDYNTRLNSFAYIYTHIYIQQRLAYQVWRLVTPFTFFGGLGMNLVMQLFMLVQYSTRYAFHVYDIEENICLCIYVCEVGGWEVIYIYMYS